MIQIGNTIISDDVAEQFFVCDLNKCKGACCVAGDLGAPLADDELSIMEDICEAVYPYLSAEGVAAIKEQGPYIHDHEGDFSTTTIENKECAFAIYDQVGILKCGIEQAYNDGKITFKKPISCHLYPIRITQYDQYDALNYDRWDICADACKHGKALGVPVYKFLKDPLIRKYGVDWYKELTRHIENPTIC